MINRVRYAKMSLFIGALRVFPRGFRRVDGVRLRLLARGRLVRDGGRLRLR